MKNYWFSSKQKPVVFIIAIIAIIVGKHEKRT